MGVDLMDAIVGCLFSLEHGDAGPARFSIQQSDRGTSRFTVGVSLSLDVRATCCSSDYKKYMLLLVLAKICMTVQEIVR
jgi:hypothetical protein